MNSSKQVVHRGFVLQRSSRDHNGYTVISLWVVTDSGPARLVIEHEKPVFFVASGSRQKNAVGLLEAKGCSKPQRGNQKHDTGKRRLHIKQHLIEQKCSLHFYYKDLICCGETWKQEQLDNLPVQDETWSAIKMLAVSILDPVQEHFGGVYLTYGLSTAALTSAIRKRAKQNNNTPNIYPLVDQHAGYELNRKGQPICPDFGLACDFYCAGKSTELVADWIINHCDFDKLYYYGASKPLHVSVGPKERKAVTLVRRANRRVTPKNISRDQFLELCQWVEVP